MYLDGISRIGVLDINHGGILLAESLISLGFDAFAVDVYGTKKSAGSMVPVFDPEEVGDFDALASPVHMPPVSILKKAIDEKKPVFTHHMMAGMIINSTGRLNGIRSVEVTGTYGKTTTCTMLAGILKDAGEKVLLHTSRGLYYDGILIRQKLSITPANMIEALDTAKDAGLKPTICVFEVSLGGCGTADIGAITTLDRDYPIAGGSKRSGEAKMQMISNRKPGSDLIINSAIKIPVPNAITFGPGGDVSFTENGRIRYNIMSGEGPVSGEFFPAFNDGFDRDAYSEPLLCAAAAALKLGAGHENIKSMLAKFHGIEGRMKNSDLQGRILLDNSNSGLSFDGILKALESTKRYNAKKVLIIGEEAYNVCDGLDPEKAMNVIENAGVDGIVLVGDRLRALNGGKHMVSDDLSSGLAIALDITAPGDLIISCVKTWR
ncbi:coenzyme F430 synthase [Methanocella sp. CWC-04]|uniref:Coenzyme F430 synthase n=1 Tax=Methanooceanicella nereidis TaxID=2052831 RepID=A0AAP2W738_9EURY|nr:coenzyme F430 synthase [Methanocella sp. CWC-04]MCD1295977.1 coenzyme F430 synthase [Methanocella sp. CWC-04]